MKALQVLALAVTLVVAGMIGAASGPLITHAAMVPSPPVLHLCPAPPCNSVKVTGVGDVDDIAVTMPGVPSTAVAIQMSLALVNSQPYVKAGLSGPAGGPYDPLLIQMPVQAFDAYVQGLVPSQGGLIHYAVYGAGTTIPWELDLDAVAYYGP